MFSQKVTKESTFEVCILGPECVRPKLQHYMIFHEHAQLESTNSCRSTRVSFLQLTLHHP